MAELESSRTRNLESDGRTFGEPADQPEIMEVPREGGTEGQAGATDEDPATGAREMARKGTRGNPSNGDNAENCPPSGLNRRDPKEGNDNEQIEQPGLSKEPDLGSIRAKTQTRFYKEYRREAEEYDKGFIKKYDEDLNTTLIFAGLFSAVTSAFAILVQSDFKQDPNEETAALLRIIIYKMDNTTFGGDIPTVPQWTGPPHTSVEVQAMLFASLASSLFCAFLAMLGKQWVNRYESIDLRGSAIERCRNRQQKLDGTVTWYFNAVMESLPLMLQGALFLMGCALSRYLWEINTSVALVTLCVTSFGLLFYLFIVVAGTAYTSCPYQTPAAQFLRYALDALGHTPNTLHRISSNLRRIPSSLRRIPSSLRRIPSSLRRITVTLRSALSDAVEESLICFLLRDLWKNKNEISFSLFSLAHALWLLFLPIAFLFDTLHLWIFVIRRVRSFIHRRRESRRERLMEEAELHVVLDRRCILWTLRTSLDTPVRLSAVDYLLAEGPHRVDSSFVTDCFDNLSRMPQRIDEFTEAYTLFCLSMVSHLTAEDRTLKWLEDVSGRYARAIYTGIRSFRLPHTQTLHAIHHVLHAINPTGRRLYSPSWDYYEPTGNEHVIAADAVFKISLFEFQRSQLRKQKVPRYFLRFALHSLSLDPPPPSSVIVDSLLIIAIDLGCDVHTTASDESGGPDWCSSLITGKLNTMIEARGSNLIFLKRKAICAMLPYAVTLEQRGQPGLLNSFLRAAQSTKFENFIWIRHLAGTLFKIPYLRSLDQVTLHATPFAWRYLGPRSGGEVARWALAASAVPYTDEVGGYVVGALLLVAADDSLRCRIPADLWAWLKELPSDRKMPGISLMDYTDPGVVRHIRGLGDIEILKSYFVIVWRDGGVLHSWDGSLAKMKVSITENFAGVGMSRHRRDLIKELEEVRKYRDEYARPCYEELKGLLLQMDMEAEKSLTSTHSTFMCALPLHCP